MTVLSLNNISKTYSNDSLAVDKFNIEVEKGEFIVLVGPSGCGKSTTLRMIAGLEEISEGDLTMNGQRMNDVAPKNRNIAMVFQNYALYPHMTVAKNISYGLRVRKTPKAVIEKQVSVAAEILGLTEYLNRKPGVLSGGQRQRVALGRAIVREADFFLMDEPLSNLDAKLRVQMRYEIIQLHKRLNTTTIYVTHDQTEAMTMATRIVVMNKGEVQQIGTPKEVYNKPANVFVGTFIGSPPLNVTDALIKEHSLHMGTSSIQLSNHVYQQLVDQGYENKNIIVGIRPEDISYSEKKEKTPDFKGVVQFSEIFGDETIVYVKLDDGSVTAVKINPDIDIEPETTIGLTVKQNKIHFFDKETEKRIDIATLETR